MATVYNCLETLVQCNLVRAVNFERGPTRYCPNLHPHAHFHDDATGSTHDIDLPESVINQVKAILPPGFEASSVEIIFRGKAPAKS
jgi:Fur family peroxide stress response transcriptional regulator